MEKDPSPFVKHPGVDFSRNRKCSFESLMLLILSMESHTLNHEIRKFFNNVSSCMITKSAFIQQRQKLNEQAFPYLFSVLNSIVPFKKTFHGFHLLACDGSDVNIPPLKGDASTKVPSNTPGVEYHQVHLNAVYDLLEERYTDILVQPRAQINERKALICFLSRNSVPGNCIFIADRGYFSLNVLVHLLQSGQFFLLRTKSDDVERSFLSRFSLPKSEEFDQSLDFFVTRSHKQVCLKDPGHYVCLRKGRPFDFIAPDDRSTCLPVSCRLVKIQLPNGGHEILITNLPTKTFSRNDLKELYRLRWGIETSFRYLKYNVDLNSFHSIRRDFICQEIYARVILYNFTMMIIHSTTLTKKETKHSYKISVSDAVVTCRDFMIHRVKNAEITERLCRYQTMIMPGRTYPRKSRSKRYVSFNNRP